MGEIYIDNNIINIYRSRYNNSVLCEVHFKRVAKKKKRKRARKRENGEQRERVTYYAWERKKDLYRIGGITRRQESELP